MIRQYELVERVRGYDPGVDEALLNRAYVYAMRMHGTQKRASGDPYFSHPIEVAAILTDMKLDVDTIVTALLHDTIEDTDATRADIDQKFGTGIGRLVDGVTKLTRIELQSDQTKQAENFRKFFLAMSEDIRVLLVKLADRTHNMRTLHFIENAEKRKRIAAETLEIYAPLAERVGLRAIKDELEDLAFIELHPEVRDSICARLDYLGSEETETVEQIIEELGRVCAENGVASAVSGRRKSPYSIWNKMQRKHASLEQLSDIMAFRVIVNSLEDCYKTLGIIHANYQVVPGRFKDFISIPKANGYSSLHTGVMGPWQQRIEVQIRTHKMHEVAEKGVAAHWNYKEGATDGQQPKWLNDLLEILESAEGPEDFLEHTKLEMYIDQVFCFTPKGDLIALPRGATAIDFAYAVHTDVGHTCVGTKVNGRIRPLATHLQNGDQVEVLVSRTSTPTPGWIDICATGRARAQIRRFVRQSARAEFLDLGREIISKTFRQADERFSEDRLAEVSGQFGAETAEDLLVDIGAGHQTARTVLQAVVPRLAGAANGEPVAALTDAGKTRKKQSAVPINGLTSGMAMHLAGCCHPLPGDRIVGIVTTGKGVVIHTIDCETLEIYHGEPERWLDVSWNTDEEESQQVGRLDVVLANEPGSLANLSTVIGHNKANIFNLKIIHRNPDFFNLIVDVEVEDVRHLTTIIGALRASPVITSVERVRG